MCFNIGGNGTGDSAIMFSEGWDLINLYLHIPVSPSLESQFVDSMKLWRGKMPSIICSGDTPLHFSSTFISFNSYHFMFSGLVSEISPNALSISPLLFVFRNTDILSFVKIRRNSKPRSCICRQGPMLLQ